MNEKKDFKLVPGYKPLTDFVVSKSVYSGLDKLNKDEGGAQWKIDKYEYPKGSKQYIAYKKISEEISDFDTFYKTLYRELDITNKARHPCTIELISFDLSDLKDPNVVVKYYERGSLKDVFRKSNYFKKENNEYDNTTRYIIMYGIARGVKYIHKLKIFHRDLKPENIVVDTEFHPHIADFGLSKITEDEKEMSGQCCSRFYAAPEILKDYNYKYSFPADIYALGLIFYQITEQKSHLPKCDTSKKSYMQFKKIIDSRGKPKMKNDNNFKNLISQMIEYNPENRPKIEEVCRNLEDEKNWFKDVDKDKFNKYKEMIDNYEKKQISILYEAKVFIQDDASSLTQQIKKKKSKKKDTNEPALQITKYTDVQIFLSNCMSLNKEAELSLGSIFYTGFEGIPKDYVNAYYYFNESHLHGNRQAKTFMNSIYQEIHENENIDTIILFDNDNEDKENEDKENEDKENEDKDNEEKRKEIYANLKNKKSQLLYGMIKESLNEYDEAYLYYMKSAKQGSKEAKGRLGSLLRKMKYLGEETENLLKESIEEDEEDNSQIDINERKLSQLNLGLLKLDRVKYIHKKREEKAAKAKAKAEAKEKKKKSKQQKEQKQEEEEDKEEVEDPIQKEAEDKQMIKSLDEAIEIFKQLLKEDHPDAALLIGTCYQLKNDQEKAKEYYQISIDQYSNESAKKILEYYLKKEKMAKKVD